MKDLPKKLLIVGVNCPSTFIDKTLDHHGEKKEDVEVMKLAFDSYRYEGGSERKQKRHWTNKIGKRRR